MFKRRQWIKIAENIILFSVLYLIFWCRFIFASWEWTWGVNMGWDANSLSAKMLHLLHQECCSCLPHQILHTASTHEDGQEQRLSPASIKSLWLRQIHDPSGISPALDKALSTLLSCCWQHLFPVRVLASFVHLLRVVTLSDNDSKQIAAAPSFRMSALSTLRTLLVKVKKI